VIIRISFTEWNELSCKYALVNTVTADDHGVWSVKTALEMWNVNTNLYFYTPENITIY